MQLDFKIFEYKRSTPVMPSIRNSALFNIIEDSQIYVLKYLATIRFLEPEKKTSCGMEQLFFKIFEFQL